MLEKIITLENVSPVDFLGIQNQNIRTLSNAFPDSMIVSRGNKIHIKGTAPQIIKINGILDSLLSHYHEYGKITDENVMDIVGNEGKELSKRVDAEVILHGVGGSQIAPRTANQKILSRTVMDNDLTFAVGPAGTGKTYIAVAMAVRALKNKEVQKIIITRPAVEAGEHLGFLPGDLKEKIDPYLRPIYDTLNNMIPHEKLRYYNEKGIIEIAPLAYMRGRTLDHAYILLDEAQNTTPIQLKMFLTRMGSKSKMIVTGDRSQIDLPKNQVSGFTKAIEVLNGIKGVGIVHLNEQDVVRHNLVKLIIEAYHADEL